MNMLDSTIFANFKGQIEKADNFFNVNSLTDDTDETEKTFVFTLKNALQKLEPCNDTLVITLNQISDNKILFTKDILL
jgi:hypothetical protein